jgi:hypothetical protein
MSIKFEEMLGRTITKIVNKDCEEIIFTLDNGDRYKLYHIQD